MQRFMSYQKCTRFGTTLDFDREYISGTDKAIDKRKTALLTRTFFTFDETDLQFFWSTNKK